jgi:hypothetical protein
MSKGAEVKLSSCGLQKKLRLRNCGVAVAEQHFFRNLRKNDLKVVRLRLRVPTSAVK